MNFGVDEHKPGNKSPIICEKLLLVEGRDSFNFHKSLLTYLKIDNEIQIKNFGGNTDLGKYLKVLPNVSGFNSVTSLAIIRDSEDDPNKAFQQVCSGLKNAKLQGPKSVGKFSAGKPNIGVYLLPSGKTSGMLETLLLESVKNDPTMACVDEFIRCVQECGLKIKNLEKSKMGAFLATREKPNLLIGQAAHKGIFPWDSKSFEGLIRFLKSI